MLQKFLQKSRLN